MSPCFTRRARRVLGFFALFVLPAAGPASADGWASVPQGAAQSGCPGSIVTYLITITWDNCACQIAVPPLAGAPLAYVSVVSTGLGWPGVFAAQPAATGPLLACTPNPNPGCLAFPATGRLVATYSVAITIPPGLPAGTMDTHVVTVNIGPNPTQATLTTTVKKCEKAGGCGRCIPPELVGGVTMTRAGDSGPAAWIGSYPNPLRETATLRFAVHETRVVRVAAYDVTGRRIVELADAVLAPGVYRIPWSGSDTSGHKLPNGVYFVALERAGGRDLQKVVIAR